MILARTSESSTAGEPVTLDEIKLHLRLSTSDTSEDPLLNALIKTARQYAENHTKRCLIPSEYTIKMDAFPNGTNGIELRRPPISSSASDVAITYVEDTTAGNTTTVPTTFYTVDYRSEPGLIFPAYDNSWSDIEPREQHHAITITYKTGYSTSVGVPETIKTWMKLRVGMMYENRESIVISNMIFKFDHAYIDGLLDPYTLIRIA